MLNISKVESQLQKLIDLIEKIKVSKSESPLFKKDPSFHLVGALIQLNGGHTKEYNWQEEYRLNAHLMAAGFGDVETSNYLQELALDESRLNIR